MATNLKRVPEILGAISWLLLGYCLHGVDALAGAARLSGPLRGCQVVVSGDNLPSINRTTDGNGTFNASVGEQPDDVFRVAVNPSDGCLDIYANLTLPFQLSAALPANAANGSVGYATFMSLSYLELAGLSVTNASANSTASGGFSSRSSSGMSLNNITVIRKSVQDLYATFNVSLIAFNLDPLGLQPLILVQNTDITLRSLALAILACDVQMGALTTLGASLLNASAPASGGNVTAAGNATAGAAARMTVFARAVAAEGMRQLLVLESQRQALQAEAEAAAALARNVSLASGNVSTTADSALLAAAPPSPPSPPPPPPSASSVRGLESAEVVMGILLEAAGRLNVSVPWEAVNATAEVVAGMAAYAEVIKDVALVQVDGVLVGLNALNALIALTRMAAVQADAASQMSQLLGPNPQALATYVLDALPERLSKAYVDVATIHTTLGLPAPGAAIPAGGAAHMIGPLSGCAGQANGIWTPSYEAFTTDSAGALTVQAKGQGAVTVTPYRYCLDTLTKLQLTMTVPNLGPAMNAVSVSPVAMLAQGIYSELASLRLATIELAQQTAAFSAMGLNLTAYNTFMIVPPPSSNSSTNSSSISSSTPSLSNTTSLHTFNLSHPLMGSVIAANSQIVGLLYSSRALFSNSCIYAYDMPSIETANSFTVTLTLYALAVQLNTSGGVLNLTEHKQLKNIFSFVAKACSFNSTAEFQGNSTVGGQPPATGTFLSGGSAIAIGAAAGSSGTTSSSSGRRHQRRRSALELPSGTRLSHDPRRVASLRSGSFRRLGPDFLAHGIVGPQALLLLRLGPRTSAQVLTDLRERRPCKVADHGHAGSASGRVGGGSGGEELDDGGPGGQQHQQRVTARSLTVYVDDADMVTVYGKVAEVLSGINAKLQAVQNQSKLAAALVSPSGFNLTDLVVTATQLGYVGQQSFYSELSNAIAGSYTNGLTLVMAIQNIAARYTGTALLQRMAEAPINRDLICEADGAQCSSPVPSSSPPPSGGSTQGSKKKNNTALYAGIGVGIGLGVVAAALLTFWLVRRALRKRQVKQAVVNNIKAGDMHNMMLRLPSALPPEGAQMNRQSQSIDAYHSLVPAALGSDPSVATDYPLYPGQYNYNNSTLNATFNHNHNSTMGSTLNGAGPGASGPGRPGAGAAPLNLSLPPPRFPAPTAATGALKARQSAGPQPHPQPLPQPLPDYQAQNQLQTQYQRPVVAGLPSEHSSSASGQLLKTYANSAYVPADAADAYGQRDNLNGSYSVHRRHLGTTLSYPGQAADAAASAGGQHHHHQHPAAASAAAAAGGRISEAFPAMSATASRPSLQLPQQQLPPLGPMRGPMMSGPLYGSGDSGGGGASAGPLNSRLNGTLNGTLSGRRSGLPPLASYTSVTNTAAPTAALNASLRTIPVNTAFNSSLRPPPSHAFQSQRGRPSERQ